MLDIVNSIFNIFSTFAILASCYGIYKAKKVHKQSIITTLFFVSYGAWNIYYFYILKQHFSMYCVMVTLAANLLWTGLIIKYWKNA